MTNQELFTRVKNHLLKQRAKSIDYTGSCMYRGENGLKCALGCLIPEKKYKLEFEGEGPSKDSGNDAIRKACGLRKNQIDLAISLQCIHDNVMIDNWKSNLKDFARYNKLTY